MSIANAKIHWHDRRTYLMSFYSDKWITGLRWAEMLGSPTKITGFFGDPMAMVLVVRPQKKSIAFKAVGLDGWLYTGVFYLTTQQVRMKRLRNQPRYWPESIIECWASGSQNVSAEELMKSSVTNHWNPLPVVPA